MDKTLLSVGLDVGTTTTQMIVSRLKVENKASSFAVPQMNITDRELVYASQVHFTPLKGHNLVDGQAMKALVEAEYRKAGIKAQEVDTGAVIITGETSRKENAGEVLQALSQIAGDFVVATAGPHLESVLAAKGAGAVELSERSQLPVLHMDIGGGTSNLALICDGKIVRTGCLNVGGRLIKLDGQGEITYVSPVLARFTDYRPGQTLPLQEGKRLADLLANVLAQAAGRIPADALLDTFSTLEAGSAWQVPGQEVLVSFSGGVADCIENALAPYAFGDLGSLLGAAIRESPLCQGAYQLSKHTIRATVIGAGCHSAMLSGSTVFYQNVTLPLKNLPVVVYTGKEDLKALISGADAHPVVYIPHWENGDYAGIQALADTLAQQLPQPILVCLEQDMAKALGHCLSLRLPKDGQILCIDSVALTGESFLDVGKPVGPSIPVVVKTLVLGTSEKEGTI